MDRYRDPQLQVSENKHTLRVYADLRTVLYSQHNFTPDVDVQITFLNIMSTQFKLITAYLEKAWKTRQHFLFGD